MRLLDHSTTQQQTPAEPLAVVRLGKVEIPFCHVLPHSMQHLELFLPLLATFSARSNLAFASLQ